MKKSQLKKLVKEEIFSILEKEKAKKSKEEDIEVSDTESGEESLDFGDLDIDTLSGDGGKLSTAQDAQDVQKELMDALEAAKGLGDKKLVRQIGNALTYFTRSQVSKDEQ